jgi:RNA polymerase sigma-70 factor (ECF subfamily)
MKPEPSNDLVARFCDGDPVAAAQVFEAYEPYLHTIIRRQLAGRLQAKFDSADVVQSVWVHVLKRVRARALHLAGPEHLQAMLRLEARHRLTDRLRHYQAALECERPLPRTDQVGYPRSRQPRPSEIAQADQLWEKLVALCPPEHQELLRLKRKGLSLVEIAAWTGLHEGSVQRIFRQLARALAFHEIQTADEGMK